MKVLDLFSGIGGFSLGLERAGMETVAFCEIDKFCQKVLKKHWPDIPCYDDVRKVTNEKLESDGIFPNVITGGFPCQDLSVAGKQAGIDAERSGLWSELIRIVGEVRPDYAIFENVTNLLSGPSEKPGAWFSRILTDLAQIGYDAEWHCIPASYVGARGLRDRVWIVAYAKCNGIQRGPIITQAWRGKSRKEQLAGLVQPCAWPTVSSSRDRGTGHGVPNGIHRNKAIGNAAVPQIPEIIGRAIMEAERTSTNQS